MHDSGVFTTPGLDEGAPGFALVAPRHVAAMCSAIDRSLAASLGSGRVTDDRYPAPLLLAFSPASDLEGQRERLTSLAAAGVTVVVGVAGRSLRFDPAVHLVDVSGAAGLEGGSGRVVIDGSLAAAVVAARASSATLAVRWAFDRQSAVRAARQLLRPMRPILPEPVHELVSAAIDHAASLPTSRVEIQLGELAGGLVAAFTGLETAADPSQ